MRFIVSKFCELSYCMNGQQFFTNIVNERYKKKVHFAIFLVNS